MFCDAVAEPLQIQGLPDPTFSTPAVHQTSALVKGRCIIDGSSLKVLLASFDSCLGVLEGDHMLLIHEVRKMLISFLPTVLVLAHHSELANHYLT